MSEDTAALTEIVGAIPRNQSIQDIKKLLYKAVEIAGRKADKDNKEANDIYIKAREYVDEHFSEHDMDVSKIGVALGMNAFYISRIFKQYSGVKLGSYINEMRIEKAKKLLLSDRTIKVNDVAAQVGFDNPRTFLKIFKEREGITPTQYRKTH